MGAAAPAFREGGWVNGRLAVALERARWSLHDCGAAGSAAAWSGARATFAAPPSRRRWIHGVRGRLSWLVNCFGGWIGLVSLI